MKKGFSLVELLVAIGALAALLAASGMIFSVAVRSQRTAAASAEITRKLQAVTDAISADFLGLQETEPVMIWFERDGTTGERFDQVMFFANGGFDSTRQYNDGTDNITISGNLARVYYGHADEVDFANRTAGDKACINDYTVFKTLARRQHILTSQTVDDFPDLVNYTDFQTAFYPFVDPANNPFEANYYGNDYFEYDTISLTQWQNIFDYDADTDPAVIDPVNSEQIISTCFDNTAGRCGIDINTPETLHNLFCQGVGSFTIQWAYEVGGQLRWFPSVDPDGDGDTSDSDFVVWSDSFGYYFNMPASIDADTDGDGANDWLPSPLVFPQAFKFTFTLYDERGIFKEGKTFTQIVYLNP